MRFTFWIFLPVTIFNSKHIVCTALLAIHAVQSSWCRSNHSSKQGLESATLIFTVVQDQALPGDRVSQIV